MKPLPFREVKRKLEAAGFVEVGQTGSHVKQKQLPPGRAPQQFLNTGMLPLVRCGASCARLG